MKSSQNLWNVLQHLSRLEREVLFVLIAHWLVAPKDTAGTEISSEQIISPQALVAPGRHAQRQGVAIWFDEEEALMHIEGILSRLASLPVCAVMDPHTGQEAELPRERLLQLLHQEFWQSADGNERSVRWTYRFGPPFEAFLLANPRLAAWLLRALRYDAETEFFEYQLSRFVVFQATERTVRIAHLFSHLLFPLQEDAPDQTRRCLEDALNRLARDLSFFAWCYDREMAVPPSANWLDTWLNGSIVLRVPEGGMPADAHQEGEQ